MDPKDGAAAADRGDEALEAADAPAVGAETAAATDLTEDEVKALPGEKAKAEAGKAAEGEEDKPRKPITIPKARFDEVIAKGREREAALRAEIDKLTRASVSDATVQNVQQVEQMIGRLEAAHKAALDDGKSEDAVAILREIRIRERQIASMQSETLSDRARQLAVEQVRVDLLVSRLEEQFPQINPDAEEYDQGVVDEVLFLRQSFEARGLPSSEALSRAIKYVIASSPAAAPDAEPAKGLGAVKVGGDRKAAAVGKAVKAAGQPASTATTGVDSDRIGGGVVGNISELSDEEFAALPESTKARARGDFV